MDDCAARSTAPDSSVSIVVPTYREASNITMLAERIGSVLDGAGIKWELVLADDNSDDGTDMLVADLAHRLPIRVEVRCESPRDLSRSVLFGIERARFDRVVVMDADLSHPPERIVELLHALDEGYDMALGSRYVPGGFFDRGWSLWRFTNSHVARSLARPLTDCADPMSGFFAMNRCMLPDRHTLQPVGYKIALELMVRGRLQITEVPIGFRDRHQGASKMGLRQQIEYLRHLYRLYVFRYDGPVRLAFFAMVGASGLLIDVAFYLALQWAGSEHRVARFCAFWPAVIWNWSINRRGAFRDRCPETHLHQWTRFIIGSVTGLVINVGSYTALTSFVDVFDRHRLLAFGLGVGLGGVVNFLLATLYVYHRHAAPTQTSGGAGN